MVNVIMELQEEHLLRDKKLTREDLNSGKINSFFRLVSETHNSKFNQNLLLNRHPLSSTLKEFDFGHFFEMDEEPFRSKHNNI